MKNGKIDFIDSIEHALNDGNLNLSAEALSFYEALKNDAASGGKPVLTENGAKILKYLQDNQGRVFKSKEIAEGLEVSSRAISGGIRKLVSDGFVDKINNEPCIYSITEKGINFNIEGDNE